MLTFHHLLLLLHLSLFNCALSNAFAVSLRSTDERTGERLIYVQAIWRHGDRAPHQLPYPRDLNDEHSWPRGWSQLTNMGMKQLYELGIFFRNRYDGYIEEFNSEDVRVVTSRSDRAIVSAQALLRGLFPVNNIAMQWLEDEEWQPISFHSESIERNAPLLHSTLHHCSRYEKLVRSEKAAIADMMMQKYSDVVNFLANVTGIGEGLTFGRIATLIDIQREIIHQLPQPNWVYRKWPQFDNMSTIDIIAEFKRISQISKYNTFEKARFKSGLLLGDILRRFHNVSAGIGVEARKMFLYSAHDATVSSLQHALNVSNDLLVPYAACLIMELYRTDNNNETIVKVSFILYKNETENANAYELLVPGCSVPCKLEQLITLSAATVLNTVDDLNMACQDKQLLEADYNAISASISDTFSNDANRHNIKAMLSISTVLLLLYLLSISCYR
uniref:Lysosomal acid phosphatase n=1 Tax=Elaeophora elaphi TaxID=1147741 RepID=A0A0R3RGA3_9BILA